MLVAVPRTEIWLNPAHIAAVRLEKKGEPGKERWTVEIRLANYEEPLPVNFDDETLARVFITELSSA